MAHSEEKSEDLDVLDLVRERSVAGRGGAVERLRLAASEAQRLQLESGGQPRAARSRGERNGSITASSDPSLRKVLEDRASLGDPPRQSGSASSSTSGPESPSQPGAFSIAPSQRAVCRTPISKMDLSQRENPEEAVHNEPPQTEPEPTCQPSCVPPKGTIADLTSREPTIQDPGSRSQPMPDDSILSVAKSVHFEVDPSDLPQAEDFDLEAATNKRSEEKKAQLRNYALLGLALLAAAIVVPLVIFFLTTEEAKPKETAFPTGPPTVAPTSSYDAHILSLLPEETKLAIQHKDPATSDDLSPQAMAFQWVLRDPSLPIYSDQRIRQRFALATLYFATDGDQWNDNNGWLSYSSLHECNWYTRPDIGLRDKRTIIHGYLTNFFPQEDAVPRKCNTEGIYEHLWLDQNALAGSLPNELYMLTSLQTLSFIANQLTGVISPLVGQLTALEALLIARMSSREGSTIPSQIGTLTKLRALGLSNNNLQGSIPTEIFNLSNLQAFFTGGNRGLGGRIPSRIGELTKLTFLDMSESNWSGSIPSEIGDLEGLVWLSLNDNELSGWIPSQVGRLSSLEAISLGHCSLGGTIPTQFGQLSSLDRALFRVNYLSGTLPSELGLLTSLTERLALDDNSLTGTVPSQIGSLTAIRDLWLAENQLSGAIPSQLGLLTSSLQGLLLASNSFSGTVPVELSPLHKLLHTLTLKDNPLLSGQLPDSLCALNGTCRAGFFNPCRREEDDSSISFDCTSQLCGCGCSCP